ncbi:CDGSH iron-sulfur domain-containing protein [Bauldia sp.]|uniref:CDGSH iron-sulfur domain-containing protein n=1 Tax=Bauldia sp. TaxID=2575872 RepID=UPI003BAB34D7
MSDDRATPAAPDEGADVATGKTIDVRFDGSRCIHARFCVLGAPDVFRANTPGNWIHPDAMGTESLVRVAEACPSGAITYHRKDGGADEQPPPVNIVSIRENGPYAFHAPLKIEGKTIGYRATLCRCGDSKNKPFCDNAHVKAGFKATGEPETRKSKPLKARDGGLEIAPQTDGPLEVTGNLEICSGTGRTISRTTKTWLCRCGESQNKPFCDGTHEKIGFKSD